MYIILLDQIHLLPKVLYCHLTFVVIESYSKKKYLENLKVKDKVFDE